MKRWISISLAAIFLLMGFGPSGAAAAGGDPEPTVYFENHRDGEVYTRAELTDVSIFAEAAEGYSIAKAEFFVDFGLVQTITAAPYTANLSNMAAGMHYLSVTVTDSAGVFATEKIRITVEGEETMQTIYENDLSDYTSNGSTPPGGNGSFGPSARGSATITSVTDEVKYGADHGVVAEIISNGESATDGNGAYFQINPGQISSIYTEEFDIYLKTVPASFRLAVRAADSASLSLDITIRQDGISFANAAEDNLSYTWADDPGWYHCVYTVNVSNGTYSFSITRQGETEPLASTVDARSAAVFTDIQGFRFTMMVSNGETTDAAVDNFKIAIGVAPGMITGIGYGEQTDCESIPPAENEIKVYTNKVLNEASLTPETVKVYRGEIPVVLDGVSYNGGVVITFKEKLRPVTDYRVELSGDITDSSGAKLGDTLTSGFVTDYADQDAAELTVQTDGDSCYVSGSMIDLDGSGKTMYTVLTVWQGDRLMDMTVDEITWQDGGTFRTGTVAAGEGETLEFAIWDSLVCPNVLVKEVG